MERTKGSQSEIGMIYQYAVTTYLAGQLSASELVKDYIIYSSAKSARKFDDIVAKIQLKETDAWFLSLIQVKHKESKKLNVSDVLKGKRVEYDLSEYISSFNEIMNDEKIACRQDIPNDNIRFCIFSNKTIQTPAFFRSECTFRFGLHEHFNNDFITRILLPFGEKCWKFECPDLITSEYQNFIDGCYLYLNQANYRKINKLIQGACDIDNANDIVNYVKDYFNNDFLHKQGLHKQVFDLELQKIRLFHFVPPLIQLIDLVDDGRVDIWNGITLNHDITIANKADDTDIEGCLYGCLAQGMSSLLKLNIDWNQIVTEHEDLKREAINKFLEYSKTKALRYWISPPNTLKFLILELWKLGDLPLVLKTDIKLSYFEKYKHLRRSYILIGDVEKRFDEISNSKLKIFSHLGNVTNLELRDKMLKKTMISLQGRKEDTLKNLLHDDIELLATFSSVDVIGLMKKRVAYLKEDCLRSGNYFAFLIEDENSTDNINVGEQFVIGDNIRIECRANQIEEAIKIIEERSSYRNYTIHRLRRIGQYLELVEGEKGKLRNHFVDQFGDPVYISEENAPIPVIGKTNAPTGVNYLTRHLRRAAICDHYFNSVSKAIFLLSGDIQSIESHIKLTTIKDIHEADRDTKEEKRYYIKVNAEERQDYWNRFSKMSNAVFDINVSDGKLEIIKYKNCNNISSYISFHGRRLSESEFFDEIEDNTVTVVTGEPGMGKSSLLKSLCNNCTIDGYVLFYDLIYFQNFLSRNKNLSTRPIECVYEEVCQTKPKKFNNFLRMLREKKKVILVLDSFDEIVSSCEMQVLEFIKSVVGVGVQTIIASRLKDYGLLMNEFNAKVVKVDPLNSNDDNKYRTNWGLNANVLANVSPAFTTNPLYLNFLQIISESGELLTNITRFELYEKVINMKIRRRLQRIMIGSYESAVQEYVTLFERLALVVMFGREKIENELRWECNTESFDCTKFGIVTHFRRGHPEYDHFTFVEFLVAHWLVKATQIRIYKSAAQNIYTQLIKQRKLFVLDILSEDLDLQRAILNKNSLRVIKICEETPDSLSDVDKLGRTALHVATISSRDAHLLDPSYKILNIVIEFMQRYNLDMTKRDSVMECEWTDYVNYKILHVALTFGHISIVEVYLDQERRSVIERKHPSRMFPSAHFEKILQAVAGLYSIHAICNLLLLQNYKNEEFNNLHEACLGLTLDAEMPLNAHIKLEGGLTSLHIACIYGGDSILRYLIELVTNVNVTDKCRFTPLHYNIMRYSLYRKGVEVNDRAAIEGRDRNKAITRLLLEEVPDVNIRDLMRNSPLHVALKLENMEIFSVLSEKGGNTVIQEALVTAVVEKRVNNVKKLLQYGADPLLKDTHGRVPFGIAVSNQDKDVVKLFLERGVNTNLQNVDGETVLHEAVWKELGMVRLLIENGADSNIKNKYGCTPFHWAAYNKDVDIIKLLLEQGANVNLQKENGETALHIVVHQRGLGNFTDPLNIGINIYDEMEKGCVPYDTATSHALKRFNISRYLRRHTSTRGTDNKISCILKESATDDIVKLLLEQGASINLQDRDGETVLHKASFGPRVDIITLLLENGIDANYLYKAGYPSLQAIPRGIGPGLFEIFRKRQIRENIQCMGREMLPERVFKKRGDIIMLLLKKQRRKELFVLRTIAHHFESDNLVNLLLQRGANENLPNVRGQTAIYSALYGRRSDTVKLLLHKGAYVNVQDERGYSPLHVAAHTTNVSVVKLLLDKEASVNVQSIDGETALQLSVRGIWVDYIMLLLEKVSEASEDSDTVMRRTWVDENKLLENISQVNTLEDDERIVRLLLEICADIRIPYEDAKTVVYNAVCQKRVDTVTLLLENGADTNLQDRHGSTPIHIATQRKEENIIRLLLENGANVNHQNANGEAPLHMAVNEGRIGVIRLLLQNGADVNMQDKHGHTPLDIAANN
ncbi:hypothetical protein Trydic_g15931, partial [Trypoxylus dichotomus]